MGQRTITHYIKEAMAKGNGTVREIYSRLLKDPALKKMWKGRTLRIQTVATTLHKGDIRRNPNGWCRSDGGRPLCYSLASQASPHTKAGTRTKTSAGNMADANAPAGLEHAMLTLQSAFAEATDVFFQALATPHKATPGTPKLDDILIAAAKNSAYPHTAAPEKLRQKRA
jgi:hypothetical protein